MPVPPMVRVIQQFNRMKNDPSTIVPFLRQSGRLSDEQIAEIEKLGSVDEIGKYLMETAPQNATGGVQNSVMSIRSQMNK